MKLGRYLLIVSALLTCAAFRYAQGAENKVFVAAVGLDGIQRVEIVGGSYFFDPNYVVVKANVPVELKVSKEGGMTPHNITVNAPEAGMEFSEGLGTSPKTIAFTPTKPGKYPFYCSKKSPFGKSHRERGMQGVIEVTP